MSPHPTCPAAVLSLACAIGAYRRGDRPGAARMMRHTVAALNRSGLHAEACRAMTLLVRLRRTP